MEGFELLPPNKKINFNKRNVHVYKPIKSKEDKNKYSILVTGLNSEERSLIMSYSLRILNPRDEDDDVLYLIDFLTQNNN